jgi:hypothetical protein
MREGEIPDRLFVVPESITNIETVASLPIDRLSGGAKFRVISGSINEDERIRPSNRKVPSELEQGGKYPWLADFIDNPTQFLVSLGTKKKAAMASGIIVPDRQKIAMPGNFRRCEQTLHDGKVQRCHHLGISAIGEEPGHIFDRAFVRPIAADNKPVYIP